MGVGSGQRSDRIPGPSRLHAAEGPSTYEAEALASTISAIHAAIGSSASTVRVLLLDREGRTRIAASDGPEDRGGRLLSSRRRTALETGRSVHVSTRRSGGALTLLPLVLRGRSIGLIEVVSDPPGALERFDALEAVASQAAATIAGARERARSELALRASEATLGLARELLRIRTAEAALRATIDRISRHLEAPAIGLLWDGSGTGWEVVRIRGLGARRRAEVRAAIRSARYRPSRRPPPGELRRLSDVLAPVTGTERVQGRRADPTLLFVLGAPPGARSFLAGATSLLIAALDQIDAIDRVERLGRDLDQGVAWTAHELRAPLVGARRAIDHVLDRNGSPAARDDMLRQTRRELDHLAELVGPLLRWPLGRPPSRRRLDLSAIVREAKDLCDGRGGKQRIRMRVGEPVIVRGEPAGLRVAVGNLLRNALDHSPARSTVNVWVGYRRGAAVVVVTDRGPGVREGHRVRFLGPSAASPIGPGGNGHGLGLSIVKRIAEAHGGTVGLASGPQGSRFWIELPALDRGEASSAS